jgi:hypothetical protein
MKIMHWVHVILEAWMFVSVVTIAGLLYLCRVTAKRVTDTQEPELLLLPKSSERKLQPGPSGQWHTALPYSLSSSVENQGPSGRLRLQ